MRACVLTLMLAALLPLPALAGTTTTSSQTLDWQQNDARLSLRSTEGQVRVDAASPEARFGVRRGDRILRADDSPVRQIEQLGQAMHRASSPTVYLLLRRDGRLLTVPVTVAAWRPALNPPAPPPPPPPPPR